MSKIIATAHAENNGELYATTLRVNQHTLIADEQPNLGGQDKGPDPFDYLCIALASCTAITLRMYARRKGWKIELIEVKADLVKEEDNGSGMDTFYCEVTVKGELTDEQRNRLLYIARVCPVHKLLNKSNNVVAFLKGNADHQDSI